MLLPRHIGGSILLGQITVSKADAEHIRDCALDEYLGAIRQPEHVWQSAVTRYRAWRDVLHTRARWVAASAPIGREA